MVPLWRQYKEADDDDVKENFQRFERRLVDNNGDANASDVLECTPGAGKSELRPLERE